MTTATTECKYAFGTFHIKKIKKKKTMIYREEENLERGKRKGELRLKIHDTNRVHLHNILHCLY